jgi:hypothetical protein
VTVTTANQCVGSGEHVECVFEQTSGTSFIRPRGGVPRNISNQKSIENQIKPADSFVVLSAEARLLADKRGGREVAAAVQALGGEKAGSRNKGIRR